jgi:hypothetical protein
MDQLTGFTKWPTTKVWAVGNSSCNFYENISGRLSSTYVDEGAEIDDQSFIKAGFEIETTHTDEPFVSSIYLYACSLDEAPTTIEEDSE